MGFGFAFTPTTHLKGACSGWNLTGPDSTGCRFPQISWWAHGLSREGGGNSLPPEEVGEGVSTHHLLHWLQLAGSAGQEWDLGFSAERYFWNSDTRVRRKGQLCSWGRHERVPRFSWNFSLRILSLTNHPNPSLSPLFYLLLIHKQPFSRIFYLHVPHFFSSSTIALEDWDSLFSFQKAVTSNFHFKF